MHRSCCVVRVVVWSVVVAWILQEVHLPRTQAFLAWPWAVAVVLCWWLLSLALLWVLVAPSCPVVARPVVLRVADWVLDDVVALPAMDLWWYLEVLVVGGLHHHHVFAGSFSVARNLLAASVCHLQLVLWIFWECLAVVGFVGKSLLCHARRLASCLLSFRGVRQRGWRRRQPMKA